VALNWTVKGDIEVAYNPATNAITDKIVPIKGTGTAGSRLHKGYAYSSARSKFEFVKIYMDSTSAKAGVESVSDSTAV